MKEVLDAFTARIKSPIFGYGVLAFFGINWKPIFYIILAKVPMLERYKYFDNQTSLFTLLLLPLGIAVLGAIIYPWINYFFLIISRKPTDLKNKLQVHSEHKLLSEKQGLEAVRTKVLADKETELIDRAKRDSELDSIEDKETKEKLKTKIKELRKQRDIALLDKKHYLDEEKIQIALPDGTGNLILPFEDYSTVQDLLDMIWVSYLNNDVEAYTYGESWILKDAITNDPVVSQGKDDIRPLLDVGVMGGMKFKVEFK